MFYRDYHYIFDGWDEPPTPARREKEHWSAARLRDADLQDRRNAPGRVLFELSLIIAAPLALAVVVTLLLNMAGISVGA